jgi:hypothetical protein
LTAGAGGGLVAKDAVATAALMEELEQPAALKEDAGIFTCKLCSGQYTDARTGGFAV